MILDMDARKVFEDMTWDEQRPHTLALRNFQDMPRRISCEWLEEFQQTGVSWTTIDARLDRGPDVNVELHDWACQTGQSERIHRRHEGKK